ncbi:MAG TPA: FAD-dependent monooxygenase [Chitinophagales bacterium]|nr:FAD-dependent monooxygenase [Chitinophagales bacterium]
MTNIINNKNILISGAGIAGTALAFWLKKFGFNPILIEIAPKLREGGYAIDFMGAGYDVAVKMGITDELKKVDINFSKLKLVDKNDQEKGSMNYQKVKKLMKGRAMTLLRSDLAKTIYTSLDKDIEVIFGDTIEKIDQNDKEVNVSFKNGNSKNFDLLIGADGLHSNVRKLVFGEEKKYETYLGYFTSSYTINNFSIGNNAFSMYNFPYKQVAIYSNNKNQTTTFFIFSSAEKPTYAHHDIEKQKQILRQEFENGGWKCSQLLNALDLTTDFYFDSVSQIKMDKWSNGRVALVGDAGYCPSLLSGKGSTLAMVGAYILAGELKEAKGDYIQAFEQYENLFKPFMEKKQKSAQSFAKSFVPKSNSGIWLRNFVFKLMSISAFSKLFINQFKDNELKLKNY